MEEKFISLQQRETLEEALRLIKSVYNNLTYENREHSTLFTTIDALEKAIEYGRRIS
ncbi:MAG: hypothetical protein PME_23700 [Priestia megaterium]